MAEVQAELDLVIPERVGLREFELIELSTEAHAYVTTERDIYDRRIELERAFLAAGKALMADGYPGLPTINMEATAFSDLAVKFADIGKAFKKFTPDALATLGLTAGAVVPKQ